MQCKVQGAGPTVGVLDHEAGAPAGNASGNLRSWMHKVLANGTMRLSERLWQASLMFQSKPRLQEVSSIAGAKPTVEIVADTRRLLKLLSEDLLHWGGRALEGDGKLELIQYLCHFSCTAGSFG